MIALMLQQSRQQLFELCFYSIKKAKTLVELIKHVYQARLKSDILPILSMNQTRTRSERPGPTYNFAERKRVRLWNRRSEV